jgi:hypothetical protein
MRISGKIWTYFLLRELCAFLGRSCDLLHWIKRRECFSCCYNSRIQPIHGSSEDIAIHVMTTI